MLSSPAVVLMAPREILIGISIDTSYRLHMMPTPKIWHAICHGHLLSSLSNCIV